MGFLSKLSVVAAVVAVLVAIGFNYNIDVRYTVCFLANVGYLDFMGPAYNEYWEQCVTDVSDMYLRRDYKEGSGSITKIHEVDCSNGFTFEQFRIESKDFTVPFLCRGLLKDNECTKWNLDDFESISRDDEWLRLLDLGNATYTRKAFTNSATKVPNVMMTAPDAFRA